MKRLAIIVAVVAVVAAGLSCLAGCQPTPLLLAEGGAAKMPIVVSPNASKSTRATAEELAGYLGKIAGAQFEVAVGDGASGIVLGTLAEFPNPSLAKALEVRNRFDGLEAYAIRTEPGRLLLLGGGELGASHAAWRFLELLGCRWFFPAPEWEVVPSMPTLKAAIDETSRPKILARRIWYGYGIHEERTARDYANWCRRNRMAQSFTINCGHAWQSVIADNKAVFDQHPEYLARVKGQRQGEQLCVSNPQLRELAAQWAVKYLTANPSSDMVSVECSDGGGFCECDQCAKLGSVSNQVFDLANYVARAVAKAHPGKLVGLYAYNVHSEPPDFPLEPNVYVQLTAGFTSGRYSFDELLDLWPKKCPNMGFYEYFSVYLWDFDMLPGGRGGNSAYLKKQIPQYARRQATSLDCESGNNWGPHGRGYYLASRLMWNPQADAEAILADFYEKAFGPAAAAMQRFYERFDPGSEPLMSEPLIGAGFRDVDEAAKLAAARADVLARIDDIKHYLRFVHLRWLLTHEKDKAQRKDLTLAALTHVYRTRFAHMNHWEAMRQEWTPAAAKEFNEPAWAFNAPGEKPWKVETPPTRAEIDQAFAEGLAHFQAETVQEKAFSKDLVPLGWKEGTPAESRQAYQLGLRYAFYSTGGEPLAAAVTTGTIAWYRDRAPASYKWTDAAGQVVNEGRLPLDGQAHRLELKVPKAGLYYLDFNDSAAGWTIRVDAGKPATIILERGRGFMHAGWMQPMYFFVPKGTREIVYYWNGNEHRVHAPAGKIVQEVRASGQFIHVPVPPGADGKCWSFSQIALGRLWFFNVPNVLAASPQALLVPREVRP